MVLLKTVLLDLVELVVPEALEVVVMVLMMLDVTEEQTLEEVVELTEDLADLV